MAHGYYNLEGEFVTTSTKEEATVAWRKERGYSVAQEQTTTITPAANLARTFIDRSAEVTARPGVSTAPTTSFVRRPVEPVTPSLPPWWGQPTGGGIEPVAAQPSFVRRPVTAPVIQQRTSIFGEPIDLGGPTGFSFADVPLGREPYRDERQYDLSSRFGIPREPDERQYDWQRSIDFGTPTTPSAYRGPTGQVGPNEIVVENLADVSLTERTNPGANIFYANPTTGELTAKAGIMAFVPALNQYLAGEDIPESVVQTLIDLGLLDEGGAVTDVGGSLGGGTSGGKSIASRFPLLTGSSGRFVGTYRASLVNWRV